MTDKTLQEKDMTANAASFSHLTDNNKLYSRLNVSLLDPEFLTSCIQVLQDLRFQRVSLQNQIQSGIITLVDATQETAMINAKEAKIKKRLVDAVHVKSNGKPRSIKTLKPTSSYPNGYVYTKLEGGKIVKAKELDILYDKLYEIYFGETVFSVSIATLFKNALEEKRTTENPKDSTILRYRYEFDKYISDQLKDQDIRYISEYDLKKYTQDLVCFNKLTKKQFLTYKGLLNMIFGYAISHGIIKENPVLKIKNAAYLKSCDCSTPGSEEKILSPEEIQLLIDDARQRATKKYYVYYYALWFSSLTGVRVGELCSLKWSDIDFSLEEIHIHTQQLYTIKDGHYMYYEAPYTKNERGISNGGRLFPITDEIRELLQELSTVQMEQNIQSEYVFCHENGEWINTREYVSFLRKLCKKHDLKVKNNHALRMSLNSNVLIQNGIAVTERAKLLGHSVSTNLNHYSFAQKDYVETTKDILNQAARALREPFWDKKELFTPIPFKKKKSPQTLHL